MTVSITVEVERADTETVISPKSIIFDLGGVYFTDGTRIAICALAARYNIAPQKVEQCLSGKLGRQYRTGHISSNAFWKQAKTHWAIDESAVELARVWFSSYVPITETVALVDKLRELGHELLFLSDNTPERVDYLNDRYGFLAKFKDGVFSYEAERLKPDPALYELVLRKASRGPRDCVYVDDNPELLPPARVLGMTAIAFENPTQLERRFNELGLLVD